MLKTKNVPKVLKCKINTKIFFWIRGSQKGGGGGDPTFGKNSRIISFFFESVPNDKDEADAADEIPLTMMMLTNFMKIMRTIQE